MTTSILILAANPTDTARLRLNEEVREIENGMDRAKHRTEFSIKSKFAVRPLDMQRAMLDYSPNIIHFCGHGHGIEGIAFENNNGTTQLVEATALADLFKLFHGRSNIHCVVLNACYSEIQAAAIAKHIPYVIGMNKAIGDEAAIVFAVAFYDAIGAGESIEFAHKLGCSALRMANIPEHLTPVLKQGEVTQNFNQPKIEISQETPVNKRTFDLNESDEEKINSLDNDQFVFLLEQRNDTIFSTCLEKNTTQKAASNQLLPFKNTPQQLKTLSQLLLGDKNKEQAIRIRVMTNDPQLALIPWQSINTIHANEIIVETSPQIFHYQTKLVEHSIATPLLAIPANHHFEISGDSHYRLVQEYFCSHLDIRGAIPRVNSAAQLKREIDFQKPDLLYIYAKYENSTLLFDKDYGDDGFVSLDTLANWLQDAEIIPIIIISLIGGGAIQYPELLVKTSRLLWIQQVRSKERKEVLADKLTTVLEGLNKDRDIARLILRSTESTRHILQSYLWISGRSLNISHNNGNKQHSRQLRAALLKVMLGRRDLKQRLFSEIYRSDLINNSAFLTYVVTGNEMSCPFDFPEQLQQRLQWDDSEHNLPVIPFYFHIDIDAQKDPLDVIDTALSQGIFHGSNDIRNIFQEELEQRALVDQDCCISLNWLIRIPNNQQELIPQWLNAWAELLCGDFSTVIPQSTVLLAAVCLQITGAEENTIDYQAIQEQANHTLRKQAYCQTRHIHIQEALGKLHAYEVDDFFRNNSHWRKELQLDAEEIDSYDYAEWIYNQVNGEFDATVRLVWKQYQQGYQDYLAK